jgi:hypothetical protein
MWVIIVLVLSHVMALVIGAVVGSLAYEMDRSTL